MKLKRILALAVSLAMVLSIVPAFEITAGAAAPEYDSSMLVDIATNDSTDGYTFAPGEITSTWSNITFGTTEADNAGWTGWTSSDSNLRLFKISQTFIAVDNKGAENVYTLTAPADVVNGTSNKDFIVIEWTGSDNQNYAAGSGSWFDVRYSDSDAAFDTFRFTKTNTKGINYQWGSNGWIGDNLTNQFTSDAQGYTYEDANADSDNDADTGNGTATAMALYRMVYQNDADGDGYTASYYYEDNSVWNWIGTKTWATGSVADFTSMSISGLSADVRIDNFKIYAGTYPEATKTITVTYTVGGAQVNAVPKTIDTSVAETASFDEYYYCLNGTNTLYYAEAQTLAANTTIEMTALDNWGNRSIDEALEVDGKLYNVKSGNIVPNGDFSRGMEGWYNRATTTPPANYSVTTTDKPDSVTRAAVSSGNGGGGSTNSISRRWSITPGTTYYYSFWMKTGDAWNGFGQTDSVTGEANDIVEGTNTNSAWVQKTGVFTATSSYLSLHQAWSSVGLAEVEVYAVEEDTSASAKITVQYTLNGTVIPELTQERNVVINNGVNSTVLDAVSYLDNGVYYKADSVTVTNITGDYNSTVALEIDNTKAAPASVFSYDFNDGVTYWAGDNTFNKEDQSATVSIGWGNVRETVMMFKMPEATYATNDKMVSEATLNVNIGFVNGDSSRYTVYAIDPSYVDMTNQAVLNVATDVTHDNLPTAMNAVQVGYVAAITKGWHSIALDLSAVTEQEYLALLITSADQAYTYSMKDPANAPYLSEITERTYDYNNYSLGGYIMKNNVGFDTPLNKIFMLGAHDSMTEESKMTSTKDPGQQISENKSDVSTIAYCTTQVSNIIALLNSGVRYLDVRLTRKDSGGTAWYATHTNVAGLFGNEDGTGDGYAQEIVNWLHDNPGELLIFDLQYVYDQDVNDSSLATNQKGYGNQNSYDAVKRILVNTKDSDGKSLYDYFYDASGKYPSELTYGQLTSNGMTSKVVGLTKDINTNRSTGTTAAIAKFMWRNFYTGSVEYTAGGVNTNARLWSDWPNTGDSDKVITALDGYAAKKNATTDYDKMFRVMQGVINTTSDPVQLVNLITKAPTHNAYIYNQGNFLTWLDAMPIYMVDYANVGSNYHTGDYASYNDPNNKTATVTTKTTTVNNADTDFNPTVITDLARFNRNIKFGYTDYTTDHNITFTDNATGASVTGSNFELPVSIRLNVTETTPTGSVPTTLNGSNIVKTYGEYDLVFNRFERSSAAENEVTDLQTPVTIAFTKTLSDNANSLAVLKLNTTTNAWEEAASTYSNGVVTLTNTVTTLDDAYLVVEVEGSKVAATIKYVEAGNETNILKTVAEQNYAEGATIVTMTASSGFYFEGDDDAYIISSEAKTYTTADVVGGVLTVPVTIVHEHAALTDAFWTDNTNDNCFYGSTDGNRLFLSSKGTADYNSVLRASRTDADGEILYRSTKESPDEGNMSLGSARIPFVQFKVPAYEAGKVYILTMPINSIHGNTWNQNNEEVRFAAYLLANEYAVPDTASTKIEISDPLLAVTGDAMYSAAVTKTSTEVKFDVTEAVKAAQGKSTMTFKLMAAVGGVYFDNRENAVLGGDREGSAAYIDVVNAHTVTVSGATNVTKNGSVVDSTTGSVDVADGSYITLTADTANGTVAFVDTPGTLYTLTNGKAKIDSFVDGDLISGIGTGISVASGAQVRVGQGVTPEGKIAGSKEGTLDSTTASSGLRFIGLIDNTGLASYHSTMQNIEVGIEITAEGSDTPVQITAVSFQDGNTEKVFSAAIVNLAVGNYNRVFTAKAYVKVDGGEPYYGSNSVSRSIYEVAAGILVDGTSAVEVEDTGVQFDEESVYVQKVLNAYVNQVGIRLKLTTDGTITAPTAGDGTYQGGKDSGATVFFTVDSTKDAATGVYTVTITPRNNAKIFSYWNEYIRLNNVSLSKYITSSELSEVDGSLTLTIDPNNTSTPTV